MMRIFLSSHKKKILWMRHKKMIFFSVVPRRREKPEAKLCRSKLQKQNKKELRLLQQFFLNFIWVCPESKIFPFFHSFFSSFTPIPSHKKKHPLSYGVENTKKLKKIFQWHALGREEQAKYYELARRERQLHMQMYPDWSSRTNATRGKKRKRKQEPADGGTLNTFWTLKKKKFFSNLFTLYCQIIER